MQSLIELVLEGKLEAVPFMLSLGATVEQIAEALKLDIESVRQVAESTKTIQEKIASRTLLNNSSLLIRLYIQNRLLNLG
ncbi:MULTISPECIES: hypothetical protein [Fischerella]|uniref:hypothetical protein n=1 Tax=Fischerella TaxID=1190 RepID=UPI001CA5E80C|nr:hypothetical protein [Fischerella muscicola]